MKHFALTALLLLTVATLVSIGETRTRSTASTTQRTAQPLFLDYTSEYDFVPTPNTQISFQNPVRVRNIDYPWVLIEPVPAPAPTRQPSPEIWINMDFISLVRKRR